MRGERAVITANEPIEIFPFVLLFEARGGIAAGAKLDERLSHMIMSVHSELLERMNDLLDADSSKLSRQQLQRIEDDIAEIARLHGFLEPSESDCLLHAAGMTVQSVLLSQIIEDNAPIQRSLNVDRK